MPQLEVRNKLTGDSWIFHDFKHFPAVGDGFVVFEDDTGDVIFDGVVEHRKWATLEEESDYSVVITINPNQ
jgi:hypothetical protein